MSTIRSGNQPVLFVVDVQVGVMAQAWEAPRVIQNICQVVTRSREAHVPIIWVQHDDEDMPRDTPEWQLVPELKPLATEGRIYKNFNSSFEQTDLEAQLASLGVTHIVLAGAASNWCIRATAHGALERGYDLTLVEDAHTTQTLDFGNGTKIEAATIVLELNTAITWLAYPGRKNTTGKAASVDLHLSAGKSD
jgi:nicotinamidase-related amidase